MGRCIADNGPLGRRMTQPLCYGCRLADFQSSLLQRGFSYWSNKGIVRHMKAMKTVAALALIAALAAPAPAAAQGRAEVRKQAEMSMVVTGTVRVAADGRVEGVSVDREAEVPKDVLGLIGGAVPRWRFEPLAAAAPAADVAMTLRVAVRRDPQAQQDTYIMRIVSASFGEPEPPYGRSTPPPIYPTRAAMQGVPATVYVVARFGRDGKVQASFVEQVNLYRVGTQAQMDWFRTSFAEATLAAVRRWSFVPPNHGEQAAREGWLVRVPVAFMPPGHHGKAYGHWDVYVPGPRQRAPWVRQTADAGVDAMAGSGPRLLGGGRRLLSGLDDNG